MADLEIVTRRRRWSPAEKAALLAEIEAEGGRVTVVARRHGISESLLYNWRSAWKAAAVMHPTEPMPFVPLGVIAAEDDGSALLAAPNEPPPSGPGRDDRVGLIEIELPAGPRVWVDAFVNEKALARVFRAMKGLV